MTEHGEDDHTEHEHGDEPIEELADEAIEDNPDDQTRRGAFELELMEEGRSGKAPTLTSRRKASTSTRNEGTRLRCSAYGGRDRLVSVSARLSQPSVPLNRRRDAG